MRIAIIGTGNVGSALGRGWARAGHDVWFGARDPGKPELARLVQEAGPRARAAAVAAAAASGEVVVLATPWGAAREAIELAGDLAGKVLIDCTNPLAAGLSGLVVGHTTSAREQVAAWARGARVVKAFNTTGAGNMRNPGTAGRR